MYARGFNSRDSLEFSWKLEGYSSDWSVMSYSMMDEKLNGAILPTLNPGKYTFILRVKKLGEDWRKPEARLIIILAAPFLANVVVLGSHYCRDKRNSIPNRKTESKICKETRTIKSRARKRTAGTGSQSPSCPNESPFYFQLS